VAPLLAAAATMSAFQKPIRDSSSIRNATESSAGVVSVHQIEKEERFLSTQADTFAGAKGEEKVGMLRSE